MTDTPAQEYAFQAKFIAGAVVLLGLAILLIGTLGQEDRLSLSGVPLPSLLGITAMIVISAVPYCRHDFLWAMVWLSPIMLASIALFWTPTPEYGAYKLFNLLAVSVLAIPLLMHGVRVHGPATVCRIGVGFFFLLLASALAYKWQHGILDRDVPFLLSGPIVFARLMGIAALLSLFCLSGWRRVIGYAVFLCGTIWTMSKGPLIALVIATITSVLYLLPRGMRLKTFKHLTIVSVLTIAIGWELLSEMDWGRLGVILQIVSGTYSDADHGQGSVGMRNLLFQETLALIRRTPSGVGLGGWAHGVRESFGFVYPHNLFLETWAEAGLILGSVVLLPFFAFLGGGNRAFVAIALFLALAQMVSGDLLDARYLLIFSLLAIRTRAVCSSFAA